MDKFEQWWEGIQDARLEKHQVAKLAWNAAVFEALSRAEASVPNVRLVLKEIIEELAAK